MTTFYIYEVPGVKNGATKNWTTRSEHNFTTYGIKPILIETIEGPDNEDTWQRVGDREWELADQNGYPKDTHYLIIRQKAIIGNRNGAAAGGYVTGRKNVENGHLKRIRTKEVCIAGGKVGGKKARRLTFEQAEEIRSKYVKGSKNQHNIVGPTQHELAKEYETTRAVIKGIVEGKTYLEP